MQLFIKKKLELKVSSLQPVHSSLEEPTEAKKVQVIHVLCIYFTFYYTDSAYLYNSRR